MSNDGRSADANLDVVTSALEHGLNSCRSVVKNYRAMLEQRPDDEQKTDQTDGSQSEMDRTGLIHERRFPA